MITKIEIEFEESKTEVLEFLRKTDVRFRPLTRYLNQDQVIGKWKGLDNSNGFKLDFDYGFPDWNAALQESNTKTLLTLRGTNNSLIFMSMVVLGMTGYAIVQFGKANYGTSGFGPSIILPSIAVLFVLFFWWLGNYKNALRLKKAILKSYKNYKLGQS